ncbi:MAG: UPF0182 family protein [Chromatiaceae bacterium]|nr:MAG: UPF0182 family protein [Chromatiaceae bacterium]
MKSWKRTLAILVLVLLVLVIGVPVLALVYADFTVDVWWYESLGYPLYFWLRLAYPYLVFAVATGLFFLFFYLNFRLASHYLSTVFGPHDHPVGWRARLLHALRVGSRQVYLPLSLLLGALIAWPLYTQWQETLLFLVAPSAGVTEPWFGKDVSYYLFRLPVYGLIVTEVFIALAILIVALILLYSMELRVRLQVRQAFPAGARRHFGSIVLLIFLVGAGGLLLERHNLLYTETHLPLFAGPGFAEMNVVLPLIWTALALWLLLGLLVIRLLLARRGLLPVLLAALLFAVPMGLRHHAGILGIIQDYIVEPDELARQRPYLHHSIANTLAAFSLQAVETRPFRIDPLPQALARPQLQQALRNMPVWDREVLLEVYQELQEIRTYYEIMGVDTDRYEIDGEYQQVFLAARELNFERLPADSRNWINRWFKYTHGYGAVMSAAAQAGDAPKDWLLHDLPPRSAHGLEIAEPGIYFGLQDLQDVIAPNALGEIAFPSDQGVVLEDYRGNSGIPIHDRLHRAVFALHYRDYRLFLSNAIRPDSFILIRRGLLSTIQHVTPFLLLDQDPYIVVTPQRLYWIQDAYTWSDRYPAAQHYDYSYELYDWHTHSPQHTRLNYIRGAVKIVIDAYDGTMNYYVADPTDPLVRAYRRMYPGLFVDIEQMPAALRAHVRYPRDLFQLQMQVYAKYHQRDPAVFYGQEDRWMFPQVRRDGSSAPVTPYYLTIDLFQRGRPEHLLLMPMNPEGQENMRAIVVASSDGEEYGRIVVHTFPQGTLVHGLAQVEAIIDQDPAIAAQFTLWGKGGARVQRGKLFLLPIDGVVTYVQPVYLEAAGQVRIPELRRVIVSQGGLVAMEHSLEAALAALRRRVLERTNGTG